MRRPWGTLWRIVVFMIFMFDHEPSWSVVFGFIGVLIIVELSIPRDHRPATPQQPAPAEGR